MKLHLFWYNVQELATKTIVTAVAQVTEVIYDPLEDTVVVTIGTERILLLDNHGQVVGSRLAGVHVVLHDGEHGNHDPTHCIVSS